MNKTFKAFVATAASAVAMLCAPVAQAQGKGETVRFQDFPGLGNMMIRVAINKGYCEKAGIKCELQMIPASPLGAQAMMAKSIESFMSPVDVVNSAVQRGAKMKIVAGGSMAVVLQLVIGNHVDSPNAGKPWPAFMQDFKGKKIGVTSRGSATETWTTWMLTKAGISADDVTFVAVGGPNTGYGALVSKQVDALMSFDPVGALCETLKTCKMVYRTAFDKEPAELYALNGGAVGNVFSQEYIDKNPHVIEAVIKATKDAEAFINVPGNFDEVAKISQQYFKLDMPRGDEILNTALRNAINTNSYRAAIKRDSVQSALNMLLATKQIEKAAPLSDLIYDKAP